MSLRMVKVNELIRQKLAEILVREVSWKEGVFVTVTKAKTSPNLKEVHVLVSVLPAIESQYAMETLKHELYSIQGALNRQLHMKPLPRVKFELDETEEQAQRVEDILRKLED